MNNWDAKLLKPSSPQLSVLKQVFELFQQQRENWNVFRDGEARLASMEFKTFSMDNKRIIVQANPGRSISTNAEVDPESVARRPCFLCPHSLPPAERGISVGDYIILPNPYPILKHHLTIAFRNHVPQFLKGKIHEFLAFVKALGPEMFVMYNGPRCGASAPDHMHFQACDSNDVPLFEQLPDNWRNDLVAPLTIWGRNMLIGSFRQPEQAEARIQSIIDALKVITAERSEPMMNIVALYRDDRYIVGIFPRAKHRSSCYFAEPSRQILVSPAAIEMAGIIVVANSDHFDRVNEPVVRSLFQEVTLGNDMFSRLVEAVS